MLQEKTNIEITLSVAQFEFLKRNQFAKEDMLQATKFLNLQIIL